MSVQLDGDKLRQELGRRGLTQAEFAEKVGMVPPAISRMINGRPVTTRTLARIAAALDAIPPMPGADLVKR